MRLALIPPVSLLNTIQYRPTHLLLPQLLGNQDYNKFYTFMPKGKTAYTIKKYYILDNGAAEGYNCTFDELFDVAHTFDVDEIVIPDVMGDGQLTFERMTEFVNGPYPKKYRYMYVCHGRTRRDVWLRAMEVAKYPHITCLGLPRILFETVSEAGPELRIELAKAITRTFGRPIEIHLLGVSPLWYSEIAMAASVTEIRSMDTSLPYIQASYGNTLTELSDGLPRKEGYFDWVPEGVQESLCHWNVQTMEAWSGEKTSAS